MLSYEASEAVFIDDSKSKLLAAAEFGFKVIHFKNSQQCLQQLAVFV